MTSSANPPKVRIAVVGLGLIGPAHVEAILKNDQTELVAIVDPNPKVSEDAAKLGVPHYLSIPDIVASSDKPDAAIICSPNHTHATATRQFASAGVHILVEKPLTPDTTDGEALVAELRAAEADKGVKTLVGHHRRFNSYVVATKKILDGGGVGQVIAVNSLWTVLKPLPYFDLEWRRQVTGGPVLINLVHDVDILHHLLGPISRVQTEQTVSRRGFEAEEGAAITFRFVSGVVATALLSDSVPSPHLFEAGTGENKNIAYHGQDFLRIFGSEASLSVPDMTRWSYDGKEVKHWGGELNKETLEVKPRIPFDDQLAHFVQVIRGEAKASCTPEAGLAAVRVCEAIKESLKTKQPVELKPYGL